MNTDVLVQRIEYFNKRSDERIEQENEWETISINDLKKRFNLSLDDAKRLLNCGLLKVYHAGNEYRASRKSVEENEKALHTIINYRDKKTISVPDLQRILGLGKTGTYYLVNQCCFKTYVVFGKMRIDVESFEEWYSGQFRYKKVNGERPGKKYGYTISPLTVAKVLGIPRGTANDLLNNGILEFIWVNGARRVKRESFDKWYSSQDKFKKVLEIEEVEQYVD